MKHRLSWVKKWLYDFFCCTQSIENVLRVLKQLPFWWSVLSFVIRAVKMNGKKHHSHLWVSRDHSHLKTVSPAVLWPHKPNISRLGWGGRGHNKINALSRFPYCTADMSLMSLVTEAHDTQTCFQMYYVHDCHWSGMTGWLWSADVRLVVEV